MTVPAAVSAAAPAELLTATAVVVAAATVVAVVVAAVAVIMAAAIPVAADVAASLTTARTAAARTAAARTADFATPVVPAVVFYARTAVSTAARHAAAAEVQVREPLSFRSTICCTYQTLRSNSLTRATFLAGLATLLGVVLTGSFGEILWSTRTSRSVSSASRTPAFAPPSSSLLPLPDGPYPLAPIVWRYFDVPLPTKILSRLALVSARTSYLGSTSYFTTKDLLPPYPGVFSHRHTDQLRRISATR